MKATGNHFNFKYTNNEDKVYLVTELISDDNKVCCLVSWENDTKRRRFFNMKQYKVENILIIEKIKELEITLYDKNDVMLCIFDATDAEQFKNLSDFLKGSNKKEIIDYIFEELEQLDTDSNGVIINIFNLKRFAETFNCEDLV